MPSIKATVGIGQFNMAPNVECKNLPYSLDCLLLERSVVNSLISLPGEKDFFPCPLITTHLKFLLMEIYALQIILLLKQ